MNISFFINLLKNKPYKIAKTLECGFLNVSNKHTLYYETSGNPKGVPVVVLHGGPGGSLSYSKRQYLNPKKYYIIQFDQRGCGKSRPTLELADNNTTELLKDIEKLRMHLKIKKLAVMGSSWGSTLAISYAMMYKDKTLGLLLNGLFLASKQEVDSVFSPKGVAAQLYPERFAKFIEPLTKTEAKNPLRAYIDRLESATGIEKQYLLRNYLRWVWMLCVMKPNLDFIDKEVEKEDFVTDLAILELHYVANEHFIDSQELVKSLSYLSDIPVFMVQGRYDLVTNPACAYNISQEIAGSKLVFTFDGHSIQSFKGKSAIVAFSNELLNVIQERNDV